MAASVSDNCIIPKETSMYFLYNNTYLLSTDSFSLSGGGTVRFYDSASIAVNNVSIFSTVKVTLSGNSNTQYQIRFPSSTKYINANGSSCSYYTLAGGTIYIRIDPYTGSNGWVITTITS